MEIYIKITRTLHAILTMVRYLWNPEKLRKRRIANGSKMLVVGVGVSYETSSYGSFLFVGYLLWNQKLIEILSSVNCSVVVIYLSATINFVINYVNFSCPGGIFCVFSLVFIVSWKILSLIVGLVSFTLNLFWKNEKNYIFILRWMREKEWKRDLWYLRNNLQNSFEIVRADDIPENMTLFEIKSYITFFVF